MVGAAGCVGAARRVAVTTGRLVGVFNHGRKAMAPEDAFGFTARMIVPARNASRVTPINIHLKPRRD